MTLARVFVALAALVLAACGGADAAAPDCPRIPGVRAGLCPIDADDRVEAPTDELPALTADGVAGTRSVADHRGSVVVLNFWASWCGPCRVEQPDLNAARDLLAGGVVFLGVNIQDSEANAAAHLREFSVVYPSLFDPANTYAARFRGVTPRTIPSTIFLDRDGRIAARILGLTTTTEVVGLAETIAEQD
ncbi:MAG: TlpA disulfide reductase family protein [Nitriliruptoraceae bacterium]